jgi:FkbM family methyltransferase
MHSGLTRLVRYLEAALTPRFVNLDYEGHRLSLVRSIWWDDARVQTFQEEIDPYFRALDRRVPVRFVLDAGAATGMFALAALVRFDSIEKIYAFEPSARQRILLKRNAVKNEALQRIQPEPYGLWSEHGAVRFRTHGALSSVQSVSMLPSILDFGETVPVIRLDQWIAKSEVRRLDLVKMDIEGAEIEALEGAVLTLARFRPILLIQAYHVRNGRRTFEACANFLCGLGYMCREVTAPSGLLCATHPAAWRRELR